MRHTPRERLYERALRGRWHPVADHAEWFLLALADELRSHRLRRQAGQALEHVAYLHIAAGRLTRFAQAAARLGSDHWLPIVALAEAAIARGRDDIARDVFAAADQPGLQRDHLRKRCVELTGRPPDRLTAIGTPTSPRSVRMHSP